MIDHTFQSEHSEVVGAFQTEATETIPGSASDHPHPRSNLVPLYHFGAKSGCWNPIGQLEGGGQYR
jgi:hypothetical protein